MKGDRLKVSVWLISNAFAVSKTQASDKLIVTDKRLETYGAVAEKDWSGFKMAQGRNTWDSHSCLSLNMDVHLHTTGFTTPRLYLNFFKSPLFVGSKERLWDVFFFLCLYSSCPKRLSSVLAL